MRETIFRGKRLDDDIWVYGDIISKFSCLKKVIIVECGYIQNDVDSATVGQFTGLLDKNAQKIYEGDIVVQHRQIWFDGGTPTYRSVIVWRHSQWQAKTYCTTLGKKGISHGTFFRLNDTGLNDGAKTEWEIIGNICDNPYLIKKGKLTC